MKRSRRQRRLPDEGRTGDDAERCSRPGGLEGMRGTGKEGILDVAESVRKVGKQKGVWPGEVRRG